MVGLLEELRWKVPVRGFRWFEEPPGGFLEYPDTVGLVTGDEPELGWKLGIDRGGDCSYPYYYFYEFESNDYNPYQVEPPLFRAFANTEPTREGILGFANRYGPLAAHHFICPEGPPEVPRRGNPLECTHLFWSRQINRMKELLDVIDLCDRGDEEHLSELVRWSNKRDRVSYLTPRRGRFAEGKSLAEAEVVIACKKRDDSGTYDASVYEAFSRFTPGDPVLPALTFVQREVNRRLGDGIAPRLLWDKDGRLGVRHVPGTLLQMLWLQFAESLPGNVSYRACPACGRWVRIGKDGSRKSRLYCSNACRTRVHRERQERARRLHDEGKTIPEIAEELDCEPKMIAAWVEKGEGGTTDGAKETRGRRGGDLPAEQ